MQNESHVRGGAETRRGKGRDFSLVPLSSDLRTYSGEVSSPAVMGDLRLPSVPVCPHPHSVSHCHLSAGPVLTCLEQPVSSVCPAASASTRELHSTLADIDLSVICVGEDTSLCQAGTEGQPPVYPPLNSK